jgi:hypothetical protein
MSMRRTRTHAEGFEQNQLSNRPALAVLFASSIIHRTQMDAPYDRFAPCEGL